MNCVKYIDSDIKIYLSMRKIFRIVEVIFVSMGTLVALFTDEELFLVILGFFLGPLVYEIFLMVFRWNIKHTIKKMTTLMEENLVFYSDQKIEYEKKRKGFISQRLSDKTPKETLELIKKEKLGKGFISNRIKYCEFQCNKSTEAVQKMKEMKRLVIF